MLCDDYYLKKPSWAISILADGIKLFHSLDIRNCPIKNNLDIKLEKAAFNINNNLPDKDGWERNTQFNTPDDLLAYLIKTRPKEEELVFVHGDYCLPNIFGYQEKLMGFIDVGNAGIADKWQDIALCIRSVWRNFNTKNYDKLLLEQIGIFEDREKIKYYILLDELF